MLRTRYILKRSFVFLLLLMAVVPAFAQKVTHLLQLKNRKEFDLVKGAPLTDNFNGIECVKLIYDLGAKKIYYLESVRYKFHYRFAVEMLGETDELEDFNDRNYGRNAGKKYLLATLNYNTSAKNYFLQFSIADNPTDGEIKELCAAISASCFLKDDVCLLLNSTSLLSRKADIAKFRKVMTSDELFRNQRYQPICKGKVRGILKFVDADSIKKQTDYSACILVMRGSSNEIPVCRGIVTNEFQTPLSHICLLTNNRKTPAAALKSIFKFDTLRKLENKMVELQVTDMRVTIRPAKGLGKGKTQKNRLLRMQGDTLRSGITDLTALGYADKIAFGSKVCNLAELKKISWGKEKLNTPPAAFAVPFAVYLDHARRSGALNLIRELTADTLALVSDSILDKRLGTIRNTFKKFPVDSALLNELEAKCLRYFGRHKVRFRSSSNCEDEGNFNGAGLYTSQSGIPGDTAKSIETAIKKVWASLWTVRAFRERAFFHIDHNSVYMAILVHAAYDHEYANGVAVTKNLYRNSLFGFVINMQKGEEEVVSPKPDLTCEQVVSYMNTQQEFYNENRSADWISFSSLHPQGSLLSTDELFQLTQQLDRIKAHFYKLLKMEGKKEYKDFAMDVEFKIVEGADKKRKIVFKQARPYNQ